MNQIETELIKNSDYEERILELEKMNHELNYKLTETKATINDIKYQGKHTDNINDLW